MPAIHVGIEFLNKNMSIPHGKSFLVDKRFGKQLKLEDQCPIFRVINR